MLRTKEWLRKRLEDNDMTQKELSDKTGVSLNAISKIIRGERFGSLETWDKIEEVLGSDVVNISYESDELIDELKEDVLEFGEDHPCILVYKIMSDYIIFTNYDFITEEKPFNPEEELQPGEKYIHSTLGDALRLFQDQNKIF